MNAVTTQVEIKVEVEVESQEAPGLAVEQLALIGGGQCITNSI